MGSRRRVKGSCLRIFAPQEMREIGQESEKTNMNLCALRQKCNLPGHFFLTLHFEKEESSLLMILPMSYYKTQAVCIGK